MRDSGLAIALAAAVLALMVDVALAQSGGGYDQTWNTLDGKGSICSAGGVYSLGGVAAG